MKPDDETSEFEKIFTDRGAKFVDVTPMKDDLDRLRAHCPEAADMMEATAVLYVINFTDRDAIAAQMLKLLKLLIGVEDCDDKMISPNGMDRLFPDENFTQDYIPIPRELMNKIIKILKEA